MDKFTVEIKGKKYRVEKEVFEVLEEYNSLKKREKKLFYYVKYLFDVATSKGEKFPMLNDIKKFIESVKYSD